MERRLYQRGSLPRRAIRALIYPSSYGCVGRNSRWEKMGWSIRAVRRSSLSRRKGQHWSRVCFTVRTVPLPSGSDLHIGNYIRTVSGDAHRMYLGSIHAKVCDFFLEAGRKLPTLLIVVKARAKMVMAIVSSIVRGCSSLSYDNTSSQVMLQ